MLVAFSVLMGSRGTAQFGSTTIRVDASRVMNRVSPWMYGSCIEDVNHEIYGGLYAQRIFGESFEEPPAGSPLKGWTAYGGSWTIHDGALHVEPSDGAKLVRGTPAIGEATVECDVRLTNSNGSNAGLILRVNDPRTGPDTWIGYEVSISARDRTIHVSRHRNNWTSLKTVPGPVAVGKWHRLRVELSGPRIRVLLDGRGPHVDITDPDPVLTGSVGVRTWQSDASFRNLAINQPRGRIDETLAERSDATQISGMWDAVQRAGGVGNYYWTGATPYNGSHAQTIIQTSQIGGVGVANRGLNRWGIPLRNDLPYSGRFYARSRNYRGSMTVTLQSVDGNKTFATRKLKFPHPDGAWHRLDFTLRPAADARTGRFALWIDSPGSIDIDQVTLMETGSGLFKGQPVRADIVNKLVDQGLTFLRYGGSMINAPEYRWKKMIGDPDRRASYKGWWYPQCTNGFGIEEFVRFCEAARITPAFSINIEETPDDAADLVEYLNGSVSTPWGRKRAANGHPAPYNVHYIEIGNEEAIGGNRKDYAHYLERFKLLSAAMRPKDPRLNLVIAAWWRPDEPLVKQIAQDLRDKAALWDVHVGGDDLREGANVDRVFTDMERLFADWIPGSPLKACVFEENGDRHDLQRALGHAYILNVTQRHGAFVQMDCPANCLQPLGQNDNGWNQGQVFFTPDKVWGMPSYFAQKMASANHLPLRIASEVRGSAGGLDVTATRSEDGRTLVLKVVNTGPMDRQVKFEIAGFPNPRANVDVWTLAGDLTAVNTPEDPDRIRSVKTGFTGVGERFGYTFAPQSYTILRLRR